MLIRFVVKTGVVSGIVNALVVSARGSDFKAMLIPSSESELPLEETPVFREGTKEDWREEGGVWIGGERSLVISLLGSVEEVARFFWAVVGILSA